MPEGTVSEGSEESQENAIGEKGILNVAEDLATLVSEGT